MHTVPNQHYGGKGLKGQYHEIGMHTVPNQHSYTLLKIHYPVLK